MLALYDRRLGSATFMTQENYEEELVNAKDMHPELDYLFLKDYFGQILVWPNLDT